MLNGFITGKVKNQPSNSIYSLTAFQSSMTNEILEKFMFLLFESHAHLIKSPSETQKEDMGPPLVDLLTRLFTAKGSYTLLSGFPFAA